MIVNVNNKKEEIPENSTVMDLLESKNLKNRKVSLWVNGKHLLIKEYEVYKLKNNDKIKILKIVGGG